MDLEQVKALSERLTKYKRLKENDSVQEVTFMTADKEYGSGNNPEIIKPLLDTMIIALERELDIARWGKPSEQLEGSREYKAAMNLEDALNSFCFNSERFAQSIPHMHRTLQQNFFRMVRDAVLHMAERKECQVDDRNRASYEMCKALKPVLEEFALPYI